MIDFRIDIGKRRSGKTTRLLEQAVVDLYLNRVKHAIIVCPIMDMQDHVKAVAKALDNGSGKYAPLFDPMRCTWITARMFDDNHLRRETGYYIQSPVGVYFDEGIYCLMQERLIGEDGFNSCVAGVMHDGICYFNATAPESAEESAMLEKVLNTFSGKAGSGKADIPIKRLFANARMPERAHADDAGADVFANSVSLSENEDGKIVVTYGTGLAAAVPQGKWLDLRPRSSVYKTGMWLCNSVGTIDAGYRGEIMMKFYCDSRKDFDGKPTYRVGDRIGQLVVMPDVSPLDVRFVEVNELPSENDRKGGFGSTGK